MTDCINVSGIRAYGYIGALPEENILGQWFEVDLTLWMDLSVAGQSDSLADTHNYADIIQQTQGIIQTKKFKLIERLADAIATQALDNEPRLDKVQVTVTKLTAPVPNFDGRVAVTIVRGRS
ncbi:dihydroneopterin aldolase [Leptolyngbya sp. Heron Island J]|uniref:dihydroneopterin aldolase n=1 Tax=Leptolyngbya sp. Heron Island J TaxID=1385935 RepID=UPI0003B9F702|nr:dihydroneopterin aldolase [Leptolyngbya sp. Heron Island J]ESA36014.1 dihydroneopterin aldolase [Leptolyngbya sp. Heron Island J]